MPEVSIFYRIAPGLEWSPYTGIWYDSNMQTAESLAREYLTNLLSGQYYEFIIGRLDTFDRTDLAPIDSNTPGVLLYRPAGTADNLHPEPILYPPYAPATVNPTTELDKTKGTKMIDVGIKREAGKLMLVVNAADFHSELDKIGCVHAGDKYLNGPSANSSVASSRFEMSTKCLLKREYPAKFDLTGIWTTIPTTAQLNALCESAYAAGRKILDHYQPIDISIHIQKKILK